MVNFYMFFADFGAQNQGCSLKRLKINAKGCKMEPKGPNVVPKGSKIMPKVPNMDPKGRQKEPKVSQRGAKGRQRDAKRGSKIYKNNIKNHYLEKG